MSDTGNERIEVALNLAELTELMEAIDWQAVPTISTAEAAAFTARFEEAREATQAAAVQERREAHA